MAKAFLLLRDLKSAQNSLAAAFKMKEKAWIKFDLLIIEALINAH